MKRTIITAVALLLSVTATMFLISDQPANAQRARRVAADSGVVTLGPNQKLRVTAVAPENETANLQIRRVTYGQTGCTGGPNALCTNEVVPEATFEFLQAGAGTVFDVLQGAGDAAVRSIVVTNNPDVKVNIHLVDTTTGQTVSLYSTADFDTL